jgi:hypothetical protein
MPSIPVGPTWPSWHFGNWPAGARSSGAGAQGDQRVVKSPGRRQRFPGQQRDLGATCARTASGRGGRVSAQHAAWATKVAQQVPVPRLNFQKRRAVAALLARGCSPPPSWPESLALCLLAKQHAHVAGALHAPTPARLSPSRLSSAAAPRPGERAHRNPSPAPRRPPVVPRLPRCMHDTRPPLSPLPRPARRAPSISPAPALKTCASVCMRACARACSRGSGLCRAACVERRHQHMAIARPCAPARAMSRGQLARPPGRN